MALLYKTNRTGEKHGGHRNTWCIEQQLPVSVYYLPHGDKSVATVLNGDRRRLAPLPPQQPHRPGYKVKPRLSACVASLLRHVDMSAKGLFFSGCRERPPPHLLPASSLTDLHGEFGDEWPMFTSISSYTT